MRWLFGSTVVGVALALAGLVPQRGQAQGKPEGIPAPQQPAPKASPSGTGSGYQPDYRYRPGMPGYPYAPNPYGWAPGGYQPFTTYPPSGYPSMGYPPYNGYGAYGSSGYGGYSPYGMYPPPPPVPAPTSDAQVTIYDNYFEPRTIYVTPGGRVRWTNKGKRTHNVSGFAGEWDSKQIRPGKSYTFVLPEALNYYYYDSEHPLEMSGSIVIRRAPPLRRSTQGQGQGGYSNPGY